MTNVSPDEPAAFDLSNDIDGAESSLREWQESPFFEISIGHLTNQAKSARDKKVFLKPYSGIAGVGRILASAIQYGALLNRAHWGPWLREFAKMQFVDNIYWITFDPANGVERPQRWFADRFTASLISDWRKTASEEHKIVCAEEALTSFLALAYGRKCTIDEFYARARLRWHMRLPPILVDKALGRLPCVPISESRWRKTVGHPIDKVRIGSSKFTPFAPREKYKIKRAWIAESSEFWPEEHLIFDTADKYHGWGSINHRGWKSLASELLAQLALKRSAQFSPDDYRALLPRWLAHRLKEKRDDDDMGHAPDVMRAQFAAITVLLGGRDWKAKLPYRRRRPRRMTPVRLSRIHSNFVPSAVFERDLMDEAVRDLSTFLLLREKSSKPAPDYTKTSISASLVSPQLYRNFIRHLVDEYAPVWTESHPFPPTQREIIVASILAFRAGLRLRETLGLRVSDFLHVDDMFELHLDQTKMRPLKTKTSKRILPLDVLLPKAEKQFLLEWLRQRRAVAAILREDINCFGPPSFKGVPNAAPYHKAFDTVFASLDEPHLGYRHFRHTFSSYLLVNLTLPSEKADTLVPSQFRSEIHFSRKKHLSERLLGQERLGQSALHAVSLVMGHTGIFRTLESYQHLLDFILCLYVKDTALVDEGHSNLLFSSGLTFAARHNSSSDGGWTAKLEKYPIHKAPVRSDMTLVARKISPIFSNISNAKEGVSAEQKAFGVWEASINEAVSQDFGETVDWSILWHVMKAAKAGEVPRLCAEFGISEEKARAWRRFDRLYAGRFVAPDASPDHPSSHYGEEAMYHLNRLWRGYVHRRPSAKVREALSHFVGGYDRTNLGAKMGTIERCLVLEDYLRSLGYRESDFDYEDRKYYLNKWKPNDGSAEYRLYHWRRVCLRRGNPRLRLRRTKEADALGGSADVTRALRELRAQGDAKNKNKTQIDDRHTRITGAFNLFLFLVAAHEGVKPETFRAKSTEWNQERDFDLVGLRKNVLVWRRPGPKASPRKARKSASDASSRRSRKPKRELVRKPKSKPAPSL